MPSAPPLDRIPTPLVLRRTRKLLSSLKENAPPSDHVRTSLQLLSNLLDLGTLDEDDRKEVRAAMRYLWLALREIERLNAA